MPFCLSIAFLLGRRLAGAAPTAAVAVPEAKRAFVYKRRWESNGQFSPYRTSSPHRTCTVFLACSFQIVKALDTHRDLRASLVNLAIMAKLVFYARLPFLIGTRHKGVGGHLWSICLWIILLDPAGGRGGQPHCSGPHPG